MVDDLDAGDGAELGEIGEITGTFVRDAALVGGLSVSSVNLTDNVHALDDLSESSEAHTVEASVVSEVDEKLSRTCVGAGSGEGDGASSVAQHDGIVGDVGVLPLVVSLRVRGETPLDNESRNNAEERTVVEEVSVDKVPETVDTVGSVGAVHHDSERRSAANAGREFNLGKEKQAVRVAVHSDMVENEYQRERKREREMTKKQVHRRTETRMKTYRKLVGSTGIRAANGDDGKDEKRSEKRSYLHGVAKKQRAKGVFRLGGMRSDYF